MANQVELNSGRKRQRRRAISNRYSFIVASVKEMEKNRKVILCFLDGSLLAALIVHQQLFVRDPLTTIASPLPSLYRHARTKCKQNVKSSRIRKKR